MGLRRPKKPLTERLLEAGPRDVEAQSTPARQGRDRARAGLLLLVILAGALVLPALHWVVAFLPSWAAAVVGVLVVGHYFSIFARSTKRRSSTAGPTLRAAFLLSLAVAVSVTVLIAIAGFQPDDRVLLGLIWPAVGLIWIAFRLRGSRSRPARRSS